MFNNKRRKGETEIINKIMEEMIEETGKIEATGGMDELEERIEALENPPKFKRGDIVSYFLGDKEITGEIISQDKDITTKCYEYDICYLDKNDVIQRVTVNEKDLFLSGEDDIYERLEDLECQVEFLANELNKLKKK
jgi:polyhydroxyalkanoate synthesis regulator phasin